MNIDSSEHHAFAPSRPDGTVCIAVRFPEDELCGYPAGHPIHSAVQAPPLDAERVVFIQGPDAQVLDIRITAAQRELERVRAGILDQLGDRGGGAALLHPRPRRRPPARRALKYYYVPGSAAAHDRAVAESTGGAGAGPPPAYAILRPAQPYDLATPGTPAGILTLAAAAAGRWRTEARFALAASVEDGAVVASLALRLTDDSPGRQRRAWAVYVRTEDPETGESSWKPAGAGLLDPGDPTRPLRPIGVNELKAVLRGEVYVPPPPRAGPPRLACQECDRATPYSTKTWRPYTRHRCAPRTEGRS